MTPSSYLRIVRASAWYDLLSTAGFATPWTFAAVLACLGAVSHALGMTAGFPPFAPEHMLMANLLGTVVTLWAILRLRAARVEYGRYDAAGRFFFAAWQLYALVHGAHPIVWGFFVMEVAFGLAQVWPVRQTGDALNAPRSNECPAQ